MPLVNIMDLVICTNNIHSSVLSTTYIHAVKLMLMCDSTRMHTTHLLLHVVESTLDYLDLSTY